ncbi:hypothetical protein [Bradyrhizobium elkanii]|uniref:Uncharacterized protein n=2 Tax=Bradyrhizobium elkanii TaxID=29448 RepID=A0A8I2C6Q8_BRAEL|nr:hypothetical protein [Bradyrhizobium elkanii]MBP1297174.1 hypothetical protein [Bradyrhizobium elkanii]MBP2426292.1 hypothetical protein [Bradyrhizobium elkanii]MCP1758488.1 hypothetical protein [Bradyrhizobium elkanii]MCP1983804.1 hypothetical protein [Bradyrhizobium elkanii]MCS3881215.1 hypothetical protein [Bradyrhizobium elkanii]
MEAIRHAAERTMIACFILSSRMRPATNRLKSVTFHERLFIDTTAADAIGLVLPLQRAFAQY